jgi:hypothetical protein
MLLILKSDKKNKKEHFGILHLKKFVETAIAGVKPACNFMHFHSLPDISGIATKRRNASIKVKALHCERYIIDLVHARRMGFFGMHVEAEVVRIQKKQYSIKCKDRDAKIINFMCSSIKSTFTH